MIFLRIVRNSDKISSILPGTLRYQRHMLQQNLDDMQLLTLTWSRCLFLIRTSIATDRIVECQWNLRHQRNQIIFTNEIQFEIVGDSCTHRVRRRFRPCSQNWEHFRAENEKIELRTCLNCNMSLCGNEISLSAKSKTQERATMMRGLSRTSNPRSSSTQTSNRELSSLEGDGIAAAAEGLWGEKSPKSENFSNTNSAGDRDPKNIDRRRMGCNLFRNMVHYLRNFQTATGDEFFHQ